tara:strand:+ start:6580 stop:6807 length:228 start_codon:yes stop_codon:yes gene_type:complete
MDYAPDDYYVESEDEEYLIRIVVDTCARKFYLYSNMGGTKVIQCESVDQFMEVLDLTRSVVDEDTIAYADPIIAS